MKIEIRAQYAATDGRMPEDVTVELEDIPGPADALVSVVVMPLLEKLLLAPSARQLSEAAAQVAFVRPRSGTATVTGGGGMGGSASAGSVSTAVSGNVVPLRPQGPADPGHPACRRQLCGHPQDEHAATDERLSYLGAGMGTCLTCGNADKCRSFVGPATTAAEPAPAEAFVAGEHLYQGDPLGYLPGSEGTLIKYTYKPDMEFAGNAGEEIWVGAWMVRDGGKIWMMKPEAKA